MITCHQCGHELDFPDQICPHCGSRLICIEDSATALDGRKLAKKDESIFKSKKRKNIFEELTDKWEIFQETGKLQHTVRVEDRLNDKYYEHIETPTGETIRHVEEPLCEHYGHGSAKKKAEETLNGQTENGNP